eukprot:Rmarinus@m.23932
MTDSLVRYDNPKLVSTTHVEFGRRGKKLPPIHKDRQQLAAEDVLNQILPAREWTDNGQMWVQYVSSAPSTKSDVMTLHEGLDRQLQQQGARETGICPIREHLYAQAFDEILRQVTVSCAERGLLLLRVRDELRMRVEAFQTLYESSIAFAMRKPLQALQNTADMEAKIAELIAQCQELRIEADQERFRLEETQRRVDDDRKRITDDRESQLMDLKKENEYLMQQLAKTIGIEEKKS